MTVPTTTAVAISGPRARTRPDDEEAEDGFMADQCTASAGQAGVGFAARGARECPRNNVSRLNSSDAIADEINNFPPPPIFPSKSSWPEERLILHLLRFAGGLAQLGAGAIRHEASSLARFARTRQAARSRRPGGLCQLGRRYLTKSTRESEFVWVGLVFCALRVSIRVDVKCLRQLPTAGGLRDSPRGPWKRGGSTMSECTRGI